MRYTAKILLGVFLLAGALSSCIKDKGNYDYDWIQPLELKIPELAPTDSLSVANGSLITVTPVFYDKNTGAKVDVDYDDYTFAWSALPYGKLYNDAKVDLGGEYNLNSQVFLPVRSEYHTVTLVAVNKETDQTYRVDFRLRVTGAFEYAYMFMTEDSGGNVDIDIYGKVPGEEQMKLTRNYLSAIEFTPRGGGANGMTFDKFRNRIYFATGETFAWLNTPDFTYDESLNKIENILIPTTQTTFKRIVRLGGTSAAATGKNIMFLAENGDAHNLANTDVMFTSISNVNGDPAVLAPMVGGYLAQRTSVYWSETHKKLGWASLYGQGSAKPSQGITLIDDGIGKELAQCIYLGGSSDREVIAVVKDVDGDYWRIDMNAERTASGMFGVYWKATPTTTSPRKLTGTPGLGAIGHWINSHARGYIYAVVGTNLYSYVEAQAGGVSDPGWTQAAITDSKNLPVTITDPVSFVHFEDDGKSCMYVFTYSAANGGTLYLLRPREVGTDVELVDKITGLGNVKQMCYWWG